MIASARLGGDDWEQAVNFAGRYTNSFNVFGGGLDVGVSYFHGLSREPRLIPGGGGQIIPVYDIMDQVGLESVYAYEDLQLKFEGLSAGRMPSISSRPSQASNTPSTTSWTVLSISV